MPSTAALLRGLLRITPGEAAGRVRAAADLGPRRGLTGEVLAPVFGRVAAAQAAGVISAEQARVITAAVDRFPHAVPGRVRGRVEATLVEHAALFRSGRAEPPGPHACSIVSTRTGSWPMTLIISGAASSC